MDFLLDHSGKISTMRLCAFIITIAIICIFIAHNILAMVRGAGFVSLGMSEVILLTGVLGVKSVQSFSENKINNNSDSNERSGD